MNGPFQSLDGGNAIAGFTKDELLPIAKKIRQLAIIVSRFRAGFLESFYRKELRKLENEYKSLSVELVSSYHKWSTPDDLFKDLNIDNDNPQQFGPIMIDYFNSQQAVMQHFNESFRLLSYIDGILTGQSTASYTRISISLALAAIVVSVAVALLK